MSTTKAARKIAEIRYRVARARELLPPTAEAFMSERLIAEGVILNLYLALQATADLAMHLVVRRGFGVPGSAADAYDLLHRHDVITASAAERLAGAQGLRNRIAHQYGTLDLRLVYDAACHDLDDLLRFADAAAATI